MSWNTIKRGCLVAISLFTIVDNMEIDIKTVNKIQKGDPEPILADVMRNITRVNTMLQELIKNYEKLEKISKAHSVESDSTDTEVEELFNSERKKRNKETKSTTAAETHKGYATALFYEERDLTPDSNSEDQETKSSSDSAESKKDDPPNLKIKQKENEHINKDTKGIRADEKQADTKNNSSKADDKADESLVPAIKELKNLIKDLSDTSASADSEINDRNESSTTTTVRNSNKVIQPGSLLNTEIQLLPKRNLLEPRLEHDEMPEIIRRTRKNNDGDTLLTGTPEKKHEAEEKGKFNASKNIETKSKKEDPKWSQMETESSEEIKIQDEELKTSALRQAYGDACLRLVVRKCNMACKSALKDVCKRKKRCPSDIRDTFKGHAIRGCKDVFHNHNHSIDFRLYSKKNKGEGSEDFNDLSRVGYLSMACFPEKRMPPNETVSPKQNVTIDPKVKSMNVLRDRYEAACQKESMRKCYKACTGAAKKTCENGAERKRCSSKTLRQFGNACKKRCKQNYGVRYKKKYSDSDSDSSSDSDDSDKSHSGGKSW